ncbi:TIR domain-containing protein [Lentzea aerocolonigenes]|uniref:TIR domain-containing protein n=1 Tax=Lentzea aerocolonigenes TaxID=68170 RepID=UPI00068BD855|nr:TIR domain-containing protein [Lentzea aerocolonigenes]MCP2246912.1 TIR domain-containing protein [Lentzea aerocolonigenes]
MIFINYRNGSHSVAVAALAQRLAHHFGDGVVFVDHNMPSGSRYPDELRGHLIASNVVLAVIHDGWVDTFDREVDWVRWEIATALHMEKPVVPVLLGTTAPPTREQLPPEIGELAVRQASRLRAAHLEEDINHVIWMLERHVAPARPAPAKQALKTKPWWRKVMWRALIAFAAPLLIALPAGLNWLMFATAAVLSYAAMVYTTLLLGVQLLTRHRTYRWERRTQTMPYRDYVRRDWILVGVPVAIMLTVFAEFVMQGGTWRIGFVLTALVLLVYFTQRLSNRRDLQEREWPPEASLEPYLFRRAAARLRERLLSWPDWRPPRSRLQQEQAVGVYLDLAETRLALRARTEWGWRQWATTGPSNVPCTYLGWTIGLAALQTIVVVLRFDPMVCLLSAGIVLLGLGLAAAAVAINRRTERNHDTWLVQELTEWQAKVGPLLFER